MDVRMVSVSVRLQFCVSMTTARTGRLRHNPPVVRSVGKIHQPPRHASAIAHHTTTTLLIADVLSYGRDSRDMLCCPAAYGLLARLWSLRACARVLSCLSW